MSMSKKDFIGLADAIRPVLTGPIMVHETGKPTKTIQEEIINAIARFCAASNPNFMESRWRDYLAGRGGPSGGAVGEKPKRTQADNYRGGR